MRRESRNNLNPDSFLEHLPEPQRKIARALRILIRQTVPEIAETVLWDSTFAFLVLTFALEARN